MPFHQELIAQVDQLSILSGSLAFWGLGQMGVIVKGPEAVLYIDPYLSNQIEEVAGERAVRNFPPPLEPNEITNATYYLISHEHMDHYDETTIKDVVKACPDVTFVTTGWCVDMLIKAGAKAEKILTPEALQPFTLPGTAIRLTPVPAAHYEKEYDPQKGYRWLSFLIEWNGVVFYHGGDTLIYEGYVDTLKSLPRIDVGLMATNGRDWYRESQQVMGTLQPKETVKLAQALGWDVVIPGHNDMFAANSIPPQHFVEALYQYHPRQKFKYLQPGELYYYVKG